MFVTPLVAILDPRVATYLQDANCLDLIAESPEIRLVVAPGVLSAASSEARATLREVPLLPDGDEPWTGRLPLVVIFSDGPAEKRLPRPHVRCPDMRLTGLLHCHLAVGHAILRASAEDRIGWPLGKAWSAKRAQRPLSDALLELTADPVPMDEEIASPGSPLVFRSAGSVRKQT